MKTEKGEWGKKLCRTRCRGRRYHSPFQERAGKNCEPQPWSSWSAWKTISCIFWTKTRRMYMHMYINVLVTVNDTYSFGKVSRLTWHDLLPEDEIWVKLGGDKGGSCMKVHAQLCNVPTPNSPNNTSVFTVFEAPDTTANLHIAPTRYQEQVVQLQSLMWR